MAWPDMASGTYKVPSPVPKEEEEKEEGRRIEEDVTRIKTNYHRFDSIRAEKRNFPFHIFIAS
jgi:hypothetical protein